MEMEIKIHGDIHEDQDMIQVFVNARQLYIAICEAKELIRSRLKYEEDISNDEEQFLEQIRDILTSDQSF